MINRLRWRWNRLRAMSASEAGWRLGRALAASRARATHRRRLAEPLALEALVQPGLVGADLLFGGKDPTYRWLPDHPRSSWVHAVLETPSSRLVRDASGPRSLVLDSELRLSPATQWNSDPESGQSFGLAHWSTLDYREPELEAAVRRVWYHNRHLALPELALRYYTTGDEEAAERALELVAGWVDQCPLESGVNWSVPLELGLRLWAWSWVAHLCRGAAALEARAPLVALAVHQQAEHICQHLSRFSSANNHLLAQAAGLVAAGFGFPGLRRASHWRSLGVQIFESELERQTHPDGVCAEQSRHYHELVLELYLGVWAVLARNGRSWSDGVRARLERMLEFLADLEALPGGASALGDSDDQSALVFLGDESPAAAILAVGAARSRAAWWQVARSLPRAAFALLDAADVEALAQAPPESAPRGSQHYAQGGYVVLRDAAGERAALFDCGPLGFLGTAAHGHADCLSLTCAAFGQPLLIDPGTYTYHAEPGWRDYFRSTIAHNTVCVDGVDQSEMRGAFLWGRKAQPTDQAVQLSLDLDLATAAHDGYAHLGLIHQRTILFVKPEYFWVTDSLRGTGAHSVDQCFHFPPCEVEAVGEGHFLAAYKGGVQLELLLAGAPRQGADLAVGGLDPRLGWHAPRFGQRFASPTLRLTRQVRLPAEFDTVLRPRAGTGHELLEATAQAAGGGRELVCRSPAWTDWCALPPDAEWCAPSGTTVAARASVVRHAAGGGLASLRVLGCRRLVTQSGAEVSVEGGLADVSVTVDGERAALAVAGHGLMRLYLPQVTQITVLSKDQSIHPDAGGHFIVPLGSAAP